MILHVFAPSGDAGDFAKNHCLASCIGYHVVTDMEELKSLVESSQAQYIGAETVDMLLPVIPVDGVEYLIAREGIDTRNNPAVRTALVAGLAAGMSHGLDSAPGECSALRKSIAEFKSAMSSSSYEREQAEIRCREAEQVLKDMTASRDEWMREANALRDMAASFETKLIALQEPPTLSDADSPSASPSGDLMAGAPVVVTPEVIPENGQTEDSAAVSADPAAESPPVTADAEQPDPAGDSPADDTSEEPANTVTDEERQKIIAAHYAEYGRGECAKLADALGISVAKARGALASHERSGK